MKLLDNKTMKQRAIKIFNAEYKTCHGWQLLWLPYTLPPLSHTHTTTNKSPKTYGAGAAINSFGIWRRPARNCPRLAPVSAPCSIMQRNVLCASCCGCGKCIIPCVPHALCPSHFAWLVSSAWWIMKDDINTNPQSHNARESSLISGNLWQSSPAPLPRSWPRSLRYLHKPFPQNKTSWIQQLFDTQTNYRKVQRERETSKQSKGKYANDEENPKEETQPTYLIGNNYTSNSF